MPSHGWYRAEVAGGPALYIRFVGPGARSYPKNSIHLATEWSNALASIYGVTRGNNWYDRGLIASKLWGIKRYTLDGRIETRCLTTGSNTKTRLLRRFLSS